jgi:hypothetical protein
MKEKRVVPKKSELSAMASAQALSQAFRESHDFQGTIETA